VTHARGHADVAGGIPRDLDAPTVVIAHGAWIDATGWREVIALLQFKGVNVVAVQNPLTSLADDVDAVSRAINQLSGPVVLVGHGYGGTVITQAGNHSRVAALVYAAAFAPDSGECTIDSQMEYPPREAVAKLEVDSSGFLYLAQESVSQFLAQDLPATDNRVLAGDAAAHSCRRPRGSSGRGRVASQALLVRCNQCRSHDFAFTAAPARRQDECPRIHPERRPHAVFSRSRRRRQT